LDLKISSIVKLSVPFLSNKSLLIAALANVYAFLIEYALSDSR